MYFEEMRIGDYADIELSKAEIDRIYEYAKYKWIRSARSKKEIINPWIEYSSVDLYERLEQIWKDRKDSDLNEEWLNDIVIQSLILIMRLRYEQYNQKRTE